MKQNQNGFSVVEAALILVAVIVIGVVGGLVYRHAITTSENNKLTNEIRSLNLSPTKPTIIGFENEPTDSEQIGSSTHPGVHLTLPISQTTLANEINSLKGKLQNQQFSIKYSSNAPDDIIGTSKIYFINIGVEYNGSPIPLVKTSQKSAFNGEPIFAEPSGSTIVNSLSINLEDISKTGL